MAKHLFTFLFVTVLACLTLSVTPALAQDHAVLITSAGDSQYAFSTTNLGPLDQVVYRFSDGFHLSAQNTTDNPGARVVRSFKQGNNQVSAYVARKNGPLKLATPTQGSMNTIVPCPGCPPPFEPLLSAGDVHMSLLWMPALLASSFSPAFTDANTTPAFGSSEIPWQMLAVSVNPNSNTQYVDITIPDNLVARGVIVKKQWIETSPGSDIPVTDFHLQKLTNAGNELRMTINTAAAEMQFNVYIVVEGYPDRDKPITYEASLRSKEEELLGKTSLSEWARRFPHDPNGLINLENEKICTNDAAPDPVNYVVYFQNEGEAPAEHVSVELELDPSIFNADGASVVGASAPLNTITKGNGAKFTFNSIYLPGCNQNPVPELSKTRGWIQIRVPVRPCTAQEIAVFTSAEVTFMVGPNGIVFNESIFTNSVEQNTTNNCEHINQACTREVKGRSALPNPNDTTAPYCYPNPFENTLTINGFHAGTDTIAFSISDMTGRIWIQGNAVTGTVETAALPTGMYLVQLRQGTEVFIQKMMKW
jgi:hypothetical protein